jgi:small subunit ribosomal protein S8
MMTDPIADMLTRIRNAQLSRRQSVDVPFSKLKLMIAQILLDTGYISSFEKSEGMPAMLVISLKYIDRKPAITAITRESSPGHRMYKQASELPRVLNGYGMAIISTSQGLMTDTDARKKGIGGEVICSVY